MLVNFFHHLSSRSFGPSDAVDSYKRSGESWRAGVERLAGVQLT